MITAWDNLVILLTQTLKLYQAILRLSRQKRDTLVAAKPQDLELITKQEEILVIEAGKLEERRKATIRELAATYQLAPADETLEALVEKADAETAAKLKSFSEQFDQVIGELATLNELNSKLIQQSLDFINYNLNILNQNVAGPTYAPKGQSASQSASRSILDTKA